MRELRERILDAFDGEELVVLCSDAFPEVAREFAPGMTCGQMVQLLLEHCARADLGPALLDALERARPTLLGADRAALLAQIQAVRLAWADAPPSEGTRQYNQNIDGQSHVGVAVSGDFYGTIILPPSAVAVPPPPPPVAPDLPLDRIPEPAPLPRGSRLDLHVNHIFVGRAEDLRALARILASGATGVIAAVTGIGGVGKTQLAVEFAHRYGQFFAGGVQWLDCAEPDNIPGEIAKCGVALGLPSFAALTLPEQVARVRQVWAEPMPRLLVFDNCEDEATLAAYAPTSGGCRVLLTSRRAQWEVALGVTALALGVLPRAEAVALLRKYRGDLPADAPDLHAISSALGDLPLALHLAGRFLQQYQHNPLGAPVAYLAQLRQTSPLRHPSLALKGVAYSPTGHEMHVARTFDLSYARLDPRDPTDAQARGLLARAAYFAWGVPIPRALLLATLALAPDDLEAQMQAEDALARLAALGLLEQVDTQEAGAGALRLHRLLAQFARDVAGDAAAQTAVEQAVGDAAAYLNPMNDPRRMLALQAHLRDVTDAAWVREDGLAARLCNDLGYHLRMIGDYVGARRYFEYALAASERVLGPDHAETATMLNNLGTVLQAQGDLQSARAAYECALATHERALGPDHPDVAIYLNNLGALLDRLGHGAEARSYVERALAIRARALGPDHPGTALCLHNLGSLLHAQGDLTGARPLLERALAIRESTLGADHPETAISVGNLGSLLQAQGDLTGARPLLEHALAIDEQALGPRHPNTAIVVNDLGTLLQTQGDLAGAQRCYERALAIDEQVLGPDHPHTVVSRQNLAGLLQARGDLAGVRPLLERMVASYERVLGPDHPSTATSLYNLGVLLQTQGDLAGARPLLERALASYEHALGLHHEYTANTLHSLGYLLQTQGDLPAARTVYERALASYERVLGPDHPGTATSLYNLGVLLQAQGDLAGARPLLERALAINERALGPEHPHTQLVRSSLAALGALP